jgi:hypothetical protein
MGTGRPFHGGKARPGRDADHSLQLVPRSRMSSSCTALPLGACTAVVGQLYFYNYGGFFVVFLSPGSKCVDVLNQATTAFI